MAAARPWWDSRWLALALVLLSIVPLLAPAIPPLADLPGHIGRWYISMALDSSPDLQRYYAFRWAPVGNLGMDLLVPPIAMLTGVEPAAKIATILIPLLTAAGLLWLAREVHGRMPPAVFFALPLAYAWPFQLGFVNFDLAQALALLALALWIRLGRTGRLALRAAVFLPIGAVLWVTHDFGWGMFGLMAFGAELARLRADGRRWAEALGAAVVQCLPLALPAVWMVLHPNRTARGNSTDDWFNLPAKLLWFMSTFRDRWDWLDKASLAPILMMLYVGARHRRMGMAPPLLWPALLCLLAFLILPRLLLGGSYVDMRMMPAALMLLLAAIRPPEGDGRAARTVAVLALAFFAVRTTATTISFAERGREWQSELGAVAAIPRGAPVLVLTARPCKTAWTDDRLNHLAGIAIARRDIFENGQWALEGQQLLRVRYDIARPYRMDPSQLVFPDACPDIGSRLVPAIARFNRAAFDYVWTLGFAPGKAQAPDLKLVWTNGRSALYRVVR